MLECECGHKVFERHMRVTQVEAVFVDANDSCVKEDGSESAGHVRVASVDDNVDFDTFEFRCAGCGEEVELQD